ncbi:ac106-like protein [Alphabaculovirus altersperidaniae]|uniref:Ac106-like protein n=1 Tax=Spodoptera eridania nucleopolyhedrovirus TaxID=2315721 RepID=A0ABX6TQ70_9ABAC|nr:ac106-like protein [Spodoptera eridania nucleopolyhedrovirus]QNV47800.1 ac106-like protein [Spodoptera eridania nucleopolyhedrovirus]
MESINIDDFARQLIADKCSALIESSDMLPFNNLTMLKTVRDEYFKNPTAKNYESLKKIFTQTKYFDDSIDYKDFSRRILLIAIKFGLNRGKEHFKAYKAILEVAIKRLDTINPDLRSSKRALLQHYHECLENFDSPRNDEHHLVTFAKEIATKIFIETIDLYNHGNKSPIEFNETSIAAKSIEAPPTTLLEAALKENRKRKLTKTSSSSTPSPPPSYKIATPLFQL